MISFVEITFWVSVSTICYAYFGYPAILWLVGWLRPRQVQREIIRPRVSFIITVHNEERVIRQKLENSVRLNYPRENLEVMVASDASDDGTDNIVRAYATRGIRLVRSPQRGGKEYAQGLAVTEANGEVLVFTDAATILESDALSRLVENFSDPTVGAVSTEDLLVDGAGAPTAEGLYVNYEMWVRRLESRFHSLVGLSGSCFAIRKELCTDWSPTLASDFMGALRSARRGYRAVVDPSVRGRFPAVVSVELEMRRKIRTFLRGITVLMTNLDMVNPFAYGRFAFQLASHKLLRFLAPFLLLTILATSWVFMDGLLFRLLFWTQVSFYAMGMVGGLVPLLQRNRIIRMAYYFTMAQCAMFLAWGKYTRGQKQVAWKPSKRPEIVTNDHGSIH